MAAKHDEHHCEACHEEIKALDAALSKVEEHLAEMAGPTAGLSARMHAFKEPPSRQISEP